MFSMFSMFSNFQVFKYSKFSGSQRLSDIFWAWKFFSRNIFIKDLGTVDPSSWAGRRQLSTTNLLTSLLAGVSSLTDV